ncbi:PREDICTED: neuropeptide FF receptor 2-like [Branchiostoma belcheri]|uniref:Neuropeptide FF receptor 2-like n=1 Tax=Branchiostoma belcheri TaxID=7741 RepID=A0A6P4ZET6_BRABE|nr:PREDICTED: neuropeptide FF receptor 2-like [Branchiostoma belcheri]
MDEAQNSSNGSDFVDGAWNDTDAWNDTGAGRSALKHGLGVTVVLVLGYVLVFVMCVAGNVLVCGIIAKNRNLHTVTNSFIFNLALADLLVALICMPVTLVYTIIYNWPFGDVICKLSIFMQGVSVGASVFTLVAVATDRYFAVVRVPKGKINGKQATVIISVIWILSITVSVPQAVVLHAEYDPVSDIVSCTERWPKPTERAYYTLALFILLFVVPLLAIGYMYIRIATNIWYRPATIAVSTRSNTEQADAKKIWVIKMLVVVVILFIVCWLPLQIIALVTDFGHLSLNAMTVIYMNVYPACHWLFYFNSAMNPVVYGYYNKNLRRICNEKLRKHKAKKTRKTAQGVAYNLRDISQASHLLKKDTSVNTVQTMVNSTPD